MGQPGADTPSCSEHGIFQQDSLWWTRPVQDSLWWIRPVALSKASFNRTAWGGHAQPL